MTKQINIIFFMMLIATLTFGCQSSHNKTTQKSKTMTSTVKPVQDFDQQIEGKYWKLIELEGETVLMAENQHREIHFKLNREENKINGFAGCNNFFGTYELEEDKMRIRFSSMATTMMACLDIDVDEQAFLETLDITDNYIISKDNMHNEILQLNVGRRAPLAVFKAVYFE